MSDDLDPDDLDPDERSDLKQVITDLNDRLDELAAALHVQTEAMEALAAPDARMTSSENPFEGDKPVKPVLSVVLREDLYVELESAKHPATQRANRGNRTLSNVHIWDEGRGWLHIYETAAAGGPTWNLLVPLDRVESLTSPGSV